MNSRVLRVGLVLAMLFLALPAGAIAQHTSPNYQVDEIFIGQGGELDACSDDYCADQSVGGVHGTASSPNYILGGGFGSPGDPAISVVVSNNTIDLGVLNPSSTAAASFNFDITSYLTDGYVVRLHGSPPTNKTGITHSLTALNSPNPSTPGTEQFGINLVANTTPGIGANPIQYPDSSFSYGEPEVGYDQVDYYKYVDGDVIAKSDVESGETQYTASVVANVSTATPGGRYQTILVVQVIALF